MDILDISLLDLLLDTENARYGGETVENQRDAVARMFKIKDMGKKIYNLAEHISKNGLDPTELPLVIPLKNGKNKSLQYLVTEGNRRVLAIKLLHNPNLAPIDSYRKKIGALTSPSIKRSLSKIQCSAVTDRKEADIWIDLKHTGANEGVGRVNWDGAARDAFRLRTGKKKSVGRQILEYIDADKEFSTELKGKVDQIGITNIGRLFQSSPAKKLFGLVDKNGALLSKIPLSDFRNIVEHVVNLMLDEGFSVKDIYTKEDQLNFIKDKIPNEILPNTDNYLDDRQTWNVSTVDENNLTNEQKQGKMTGSGPKGGNRPPGTRSIRLSKNRIRMIDFSLKIGDKRINEIYRELKDKLNVHESPNAVAVLFRVFLELTCDYYLEANKIKRKDNNKRLIRDDILRLKVEHVANYLEDSGLLTRAQAKGVRKSASTENELVSVNSLNQYVHASELSPIPTEINKLMDNWAHFFKAIWK